MYQVYVEEFCHFMVLLVSGTCFGFLCQKYLCKWKENPSRYRTGHRWFYYLIVHCGMFSLRKSGGAQKSSISCLEATLLVMPKYKTQSYRRTKQQENEGVTNRKERKALESKPW